MAFTAPLAHSVKWIKSFTADPASLTTDTANSTNLTTTFKAAKKGDIFLVCAPDLEAGLICVAVNRVATSGTLTVVVKNVSAGTVDAASQEFITIGL